jgi:hypothetical protein
MNNSRMGFGNVPENVVVRETRVTHSFYGLIWNFRTSRSFIAR